jgi:anti-sigma B factor antagonist
MSDMIRHRAASSGGAMHDPDWLDELAQPGELMIKGVCEPDAFLLSLYGELDLATSPLLEAKLRMVESTNSERIVIDLSGLTFIDSTGLHALVRAELRWRASGRGLVLLRGPRAVQRVFELTKALSLFTFED